MEEGAVSRIEDHAVSPRFVSPIHEWAAHKKMGEAITAIGVFSLNGTRRVCFTSICEQTDPVTSRPQIDHTV